MVEILMEVNMEKLKKLIEKEELELNKMMENDEYVSPDMLDKALSISRNKSILISKLQKQISDALNYIEDIHILEKVQNRLENDNGVRYTLEDLKEINKERKNNKK